LNKAQQEGFWGHMNPFARKKWVNNRISPIKGELNELDEVNAKNANDIKDVDGRAQAGIGKAQTAADAANQAALAAADQARQAGDTAQNTAGRMDKLNNTVANLDQYHQISEVDVVFHGAEPILSADSRKKLDDLATSLANHQGYILEVEAHAPGAGSVGIQSSQRLAEAVKRYLVTEHQIPVYRMHSVAMGNAPAANEQDAKPVKTRTVHIQLMENSLAASR
jgi:outer membrane protein OmpA-like peptidoglycan-associated protein